MLNCKPNPKTTALVILDFGHAAHRLRPRPAHAAYANAWSQHWCYFPGLVGHGS